MTFVADAALTLPSPVGSDEHFGRTVAISRDGLVMAVAQYGWSPSGGAGGVFVFDRVGAAWVQRGSVLQAGDAAGNYNYGYGLALNEDGSVLAVGSPGHVTSYVAYGAVYIYDWSGSAWVQRGDRLLAGDGGSGDRFGQSVALSAAADVLVVGAPQWDAGFTDQGGVYILDWSGSEWVQRGSVLTAPSPAASAYFGYTVAISADSTVLAIGAHKPGSLSNQGAVYLFDWSGSAWVDRAVFYDPSAAAGDYFGLSLCLAGGGDYLLAGSPYREVSSITDAGRAALFHWSGGTWSLTDTFTAADAGMEDLYGFGAAISEDVVTAVIGSYNWEDTHTNQGVVYTYINDSPPVIDPPPETPAELPSAPHVYSLSAYIAGAADSLPDYAFSLTSFGLSKRSSAVSYYSISMQFTADLIDALTARPNGIIYILRDGAAWESFNVSHPVRYDLGPRSASISISGTRQETIADPVTIAIEPHMATDAGINSSGALTLDLVPGYADPRPGDSITWDGVTYLVDLIKYQDGQTLSINASEVV